ncbi:MAG: 50S ribosomal protein L10 [Candidatus Wildermuthbacteria bacterium RIFCSPHIGHO2_02_FULL_47_12]|uniref:Large ribosomal subunit protein uL10 n=1 Tax=Candidatus Wildermuthbacteria bacterium RIFCSPHIGHO2_02_FULL_47_12 TaxID=1802451 RepID=A0A1G2R3N1_9BACT|nr:MAG: 50S ribosomal protein L10 [Candidatus Wildermuthbacteria bacterium RIFCSPHIGHO2_02_FULL_47_12]
MPKTKAQKATTLKGLGEHVEKQHSILFINYKGIKVKELLVLRKQLKDLGAKLQVAKKTLLKKALQEKGIDMDLKGMEGQIAAIFSFQDAFSPIKSVAAFAKTAENIKILGGYIESQVRDERAMKEIASLPSKEELLGRLVGSIASPMSGFLTVMQGNIKGLVVALNAIANK